MKPKKWASQGGQDGDVSREAGNVTDNKYIDKTKGTHDFRAQGPCKQKYILSFP